MFKKMLLAFFILCVFSLSLYDGKTFAAAGWFACFYDGSGCAQVSDQYGPTYAPAQTSMAACEAVCTF